VPGIGPNVGAFVTKLLPHWFVFSLLYLSIGPRLIDTQGIKELSTFTFVDQIQLSNCMCCWMLVNWIYRGLCRIYITLSPRHPILSLEPPWGGWFDIVKKWRWIFNDMDRALSSLIVEKLLQQASSVSEAFRCVYHVQVRFWNHHFVSWLLGVQDPEQENSYLRAVWCDSNLDVLSDNYERIGFDILQLLSMFHLASIITTPLNIILRDCYHHPAEMRGYHVYFNQKVTWPWLIIATKRQTNAIQSKKLKAARLTVWLTSKWITCRIYAT